MGGKLYSVIVVIIICILFNAVSGSNARGADWVPFAIDSLDNECFYDQSSIRIASKGIIKVWSKTVYGNVGRADLIQDFKKIGLMTKELQFLEHSKQLYNLNCNESKYRVTKNSVYSNDGNVLHSYQNDSSQWREVTPESVAETLLRTVCSKSNASKK
jgi:hypothetical protein